MIYFGWNQFLLHWKDNVILALEISVVMLLSIILVSSYYRQSAEYLPFRDILESEGVQYAASDVFESGEDGEIVPGELLNRLDGVEGIYYTVSGNVMINENISVDVIGYSEPLAGYRPEMEQGCWFTEAEEADEISVCLTHNTYGIQCGDTIQLMKLNENGLIIGAVKAKVCGILANNASYFHPTGIEQPASFFSAFQVYDAVNNEYDAATTYLFMDADSARTVFGDYVGPDYSFYIEYAESVTEQQEEENAELLLSAGYYVTFAELRESIAAELRPKLFMLIPIILCVLVFAALNSILSSVIFTKKELYSYAVLYTEGMRWYGILRMKLVQGLLLVLLSGIFLAAELVTVTRSGFFAYAAIEHHTEADVLCLLTGLFALTLQTAVPYFCIFRKNAAEILQEVRR